MIAYFPELYDDELAYSWFARYFAHMYPAYTSALEDLLEERTMRVDVEFIGRLNEDARSAITRVVPMEELVLKHTMLHYYRFTSHVRFCRALNSMAVSWEDAHRLLPVPKSRADSQARHIRYCPLCAVEARENYGEAYWTRQANLRNMDICTRHRCRLKDTGIEISGRKSPRLYVAEAEIMDVEPEPVEEGLELEFARYLAEVFCKPVDLGNTTAIGEFLNSRLEGTKYLSARGMMRNAGLLLDDFLEFYQELPVPGLTKLSQMQKIFTGYRWDFYEVCQIAFFLGTSTDDLANPKLPEKSQTERFNEKVAGLYEQGLGCHRIARELGCSPSTAKNANKIKTKKKHDYSVRKGMRREDWGRMDENMVPAVRDACEQIFHNHGSRPGHVTVHAVCRRLGLPDKRFDYLPKCKEVIHGCEEPKEVYWAREVAWCYAYLLESKEEADIHWRDIRDITNLSRDNFTASFPHLQLFMDEVTEGKIRNLLP